MESFNEYILKIASLCNINCLYCYEYNLGDNSWKRQPKFMSGRTCQVLAKRIQEHSVNHNVKNVAVSFHGGEPLLVGPKRLDEYCSILRKSSAGYFNLALRVQTNAMLVNEEICSVLKKHKVSVSVSLDGDEAANNRHRLDHSKVSTYNKALDGIRLIQNCTTHQPVNILAVIDIRNSPKKTFDSLASLGVSRIDFLLPHHNWDNPPPRLVEDEIVPSYGQWYMEIFDAWVSGRHAHIDIRFFKNILARLVDRPAIFEGMNLDPSRLITITPNGDYEGVDCLKSTASGLQQTGLNVRDSSLDEVLENHYIAIRQSGVNQLCSVCKDCRYSKVCAGGYFPHRYSRDREFENPSVYCSDNFWILEQIENRLIQLSSESPKKRLPS